MILRKSQILLPVQKGSTNFALALHGRPLACCVSQRPDSPPCIWANPPCLPPRSNSYSRNRIAGRWPTITAEFARQKPPTPESPMRREGLPLHIGFASPLFEIPELTFAKRPGGPTAGGVHGPRSAGSWRQKTRKRRFHRGKVLLCSRFNSQGTAMAQSRRNVLDVQRCAMMHTVYVSIVNIARQ